MVLAVTVPTLQRSLNWRQTLALALEGKTHWRSRIRIRTASSRTIPVFAQGMKVVIGSILLDCPLLHGEGCVSIAEG